MAGIHSIGWWVPEGRRSVESLAAISGISEQVLATFGLISCTEAGEGDHPSTMGARAVAHALAAADLSIDDISLLIFAGMTRDYAAPWVGAFGVLHELGATQTAGFDISNRCASVHDALWLAAKLIEAGAQSRVVVCCADRFDYLADPNRPATTPSDVAYSAGAAAAVVTGDAQNEIVAFSSYTNPDLSVHLQGVPIAGGTRPPVEPRPRRSRPSGVHAVQLGQVRNLVEYVRDADAHNLTKLKADAGFEAIDFAIASPIDVEAQLASYAAQGIDRDKTYFLLSRLGHLGPADTLVNLACAIAAGKELGTRVVLSTRTATYANALALRATGETLGILVDGSGITQAEIDQHD